MQENTAVTQRNEKHQKHRLHTGTRVTWLAQGASEAEAHGLGQTRQCAPTQTFPDFQDLRQHPP